MESSKIAIVPIQHRKMGKANIERTKISMAILATLPIIAWYKIPFPVGLGYAVILFWSAFVIFKNNFKINVVPKVFWILVGYVSLNWIYQNHFAIKSFFPPGGWRFLIFLLAIIGGVITFDLGLLQKYMRRIVLVSSVLFWIQIIILIVYGSNLLCFVPNLTGAFTYEDMTYSDLVRVHLYSLHPCSIFLEKSYMAYYFISYLAITWFSDENKSKLINKEIAFIIFTLIILRSGTGYIGIAILGIAKIFIMFTNAKLGKRITILTVMVPILTGAVIIFSKSQLGDEMISRSDEFSMEGSSGFERVIGGYLMFASLNNKEKLIGIPDPADTFGTRTSNGDIKFYVNGFQTILLTLGYIGTLVYIFFYSMIFIKIGLSSRLCIIVLLIFSFLESNYLNPYMILLTIIPCADYYKRIILKKNENTLHLYSVIR